MNLGGGSGPDGTEGGGYPPACNEVRLVNAGGGIMECLTLQEACARGLVEGSLCTARSTSNTSQLDSNLSVSQAPQSSDAGCLVCGGFLMLVVIADVIFGTNFIIRRGKS
jgi:hypothetical protein